MNFPVRKSTSILTLTSDRCYQLYQPRDKLEIRTSSQTVTCHSTDRITDKHQRAVTEVYCAWIKFMVCYRTLRMPLRRHLDVQDLTRAVGCCIAAGTPEPETGGSAVWSQPKCHFKGLDTLPARQQTDRVNRRNAGVRQRATNRCSRPIPPHLMKSAARNRFSNVTRLQSNFREASGTTASTQTARNRLHDAGFLARRPAVRVPLIGRHRQERLQWCHAKTRLSGLQVYRWV